MITDILKREDYSISIDELEKQLKKDRKDRENIEQTIFFGNGINLLFPSLLNGSFNTNQNNKNQNNKNKNKLKQLKSKWHH